MITLITGLQCAGTSIIMQMLEAGGMPLVLREDIPPDRSWRYRWPFDEHLQRFPNLIDRAEGRGIRVFSYDLKYLPPEREYRFIFVQRNLDEVVASASRIQVFDNRLSAHLEMFKSPYLLRTHLQQTNRWLEEKAMRLLRLEFKDIINNPSMVIDELEHFLPDVNLQREAMEQVVHKTQVS